MLYKLPLPKRSGDLQWRVLHGALATNVFQSVVDRSVGEGCVFCNTLESVQHVLNVIMCCLYCLYSLLYVGRWKWCSLRSFTYWGPGM